MLDVQSFFKGAFSVDNVIFGFDEAGLRVLLIRRNEAPYDDYWALPGNLVYPDEDLSSAAARVLFEITGLKDIFLEQVETFGAVDRHPLGRVITIAYYSLVNSSNLKIAAASLAEEVRWHKMTEIGELAFDHNEILKKCFSKLQENVMNKPVGFELLPEKFTLTELQSLYEAILCVELDKRNFRKKIHSMNILKDREEYQEGVAHRPAKLFSFEEKRYRELQSAGYVFTL